MVFWRRARGAVGQVVHGYRLMPLVGQVYHGVFPRPKNASPKRFLNGLSNPLHKKIKLTPRGISFISGGEQVAQSVRWFTDIDLCRLWVRFITECSHALKTLPRSVFLTGFRIPCIKIKLTPCGISFISGGEQGIRTLEQVIARYTISNRAPSTSSDNSPYLQSNAQLLYTSRSKKSSVFS